MEMVNKRGDVTALVLFIVLAILVVVISGIYVYMADITNVALKDALGKQTIGTINVNQTIQDTFGQVAVSYQTLSWLTTLMIVGMILSIFIGSYLVTTKPVFFVPYIFVVIIAVLVGTEMSNAYEILINDPLLQSAYAGFTSSNWMLLHLPLILSIVGFIGAIIMFSRLGKKAEYDY
jgi:hypothetical protein